MNVVVDALGRPAPGAKPQALSQGAALQGFDMARALLALALLAALLAGCASGTKQVSNTVDSFRYTGTWDNNVGTERFAWQNTRGQAEVYVPQAGDAGSLAVRVTDASGATVHDDTYAGPGATRVRTAAGPPGEWTVTLVFDAFKGPVDVSVRAVAPATPP